MKKIAFPLFALVLVFAACKEKDLSIPALTVGKHRVLVEEITGVNCPNCPKGARELAALQNAVGKENIIIVGMHAAGSPLSDPITGSKYNFQFDEGTALRTYIGELFAAPSAAIDRIWPAGEDTPLFVDGWTAKINKQLAKDYNLGLFIGNKYNTDTRQLDITVSIAPGADQPGDHHLTVLITQDSIMDAQYDGSELIPNYMHRHVLRDVVSSIAGDDISQPLTANALIYKTYSVTLDPKWDAAHCSVVAYVHRNGATDKEILQAAEEHVEK